MTPFRRPAALPARGRTARTRRAAAVVACAALVACGATLVVACAGSGGASDLPTASSHPAGPTPVPSPPITAGPPPAGAVDVVRRFWNAVGRGDLKRAQDQYTSPDSEIRHWEGTDIAAARFVRVVPSSTVRGSIPGATIEFAVEVWIKPSGSDNAWGPTRVHWLFENVVRMSDGTWRLVESGTGP
jgi:hypothetical protein